jgi:environmental stress-induced protein Ves
MTDAPRIRHLPATGQEDMAWKNGLGRTAEIARHPAAGTVFDWRLSIATIEADGAFSAFTGCDRTLIPIEGAGLALDFADGETIAAMRFAGERACFGRLLAGRTRDLNVIVRRSAYAHAVTVVGPSASVTNTGETMFVVALGGAVAATADGGQWRLGPDDALRIDGPGIASHLTAIDADARAAVVILRRVPA